MYFYNGTCTINDDDEAFCEDGMIVLHLNDVQYTQVMKELSKLKGGQFTKIYNILEKEYKENYGTCCGVEFRSAQKNVICNGCGKVVGLT